MSRIGKMPIALTEKVEVTIAENNIKVKGPLGELSFDFSKKVNVVKEENSIIVTPVDDSAIALWGTTRSIINNLVIGVSEGFKKSLEISGVGYKFEVSGQKLTLSIGFSHKVDMEVPASLKAEIDAKDKNILHISGIDKQIVGEFASKVRAKKKPEPYKGKGIKYVGEHIRRKAGKTGSK
ncbi:50S ribosomal protein L6 [Candidatus Gracilibacteria bacterium]|nr:50S ribosomal protein L6 [Candidatus Gracilibacteria bacterium]